METFKPNPEDYSTVSLLGHCFGNIGTVLLSKHKSNALVAIKQFDLEKIDDNEVLSELQRDIIYTKQLKHKNILSYDSCFLDKQLLCIISELYGYGSCTDLIARHFPNGLPELVICLVLCDVLKALQYLHAKGFIHRAIRGSHILLAANGRAVLTGLRYATSMVINGKWCQQIYSFPDSTAVNLNWLSPELLEQNMDGYNEKSDIYSIGITAAELANGRVPFADLSNTLMLTEKVRGFTPQLMDCTTLPVSDCESNEDASQENVLTCRVKSSSFDGSSTKRFSDSFHQFTEICLIRDPILRPSASQLQNHSFFKQLKSRADISQLLHPVIPFNDESIQSDLDGLSAILANSNRMAEINITNFEWNF